MFIDATTPDMQGFDPSVSGSMLPPVGIYTGITIQIIGSEQGETTNGSGKLDIIYEALNGEISGQQFKLMYNVGNNNADTAKWAVQDVMRVAYGVTGVNYVGKRFNFDEKMYFKPFIATLAITEKPGKDKDGNTHDQSGRPIMWKNGKLTAIKPLAGQPQQASNPVGQPQQAQQPTGQPQVAPATPPWHNKG